jgi:hypothetical protein
MKPPETLPPPGSADAPPYWMHETSGVLAAAVAQFLENPNACTLNQLSYLRAYFKLWVDAKVWDSNPAHDDESRADLARLRARCHGITNVADMRAWLDEAVAAGMDPL